MKKHSVVPILALSIIFIFGYQIIPTNNITTFWGVNPTETYDYDLNHVSIEYNFPFENYSATGILFDNSTIVEQGNTITMVVNEINSSAINFDLTFGSQIENVNRSISEVEERIKNLMQLPLKLGLQEYNLSDIKRGFTGIDYTVIPNVNDTWVLFETLSSPVYVLVMEEIFSSKAIVNLEALTELNLTTDDCIFEWYANGTYNDLAKNEQFNFCYNLKMAYQVSTGLLLGMRTDLAIDGNEGNSSTNVIINSEVVKHGYTLEDFKLPTGEDFDIDDWLSDLLPSNLWLIVPISIATILLIRLKIKK